MTKSYNIFFVILFLLCLGGVRAQDNPAYLQNQTPGWEEVIERYRALGERFDDAQLIESGTTDVGKPLHLFMISRDGLFTPEKVHDADRRIIFINNGIHPGESNGIDASLELATEILSGNQNFDRYLENTVILIVPVFNVGGALNRSPFHRANQNGPEEQGFRGNARNLDLNRDFVKMDSRNTRSIAKTIQAWDPDIIIDTHSSNGADYPYTVTLIPSHHQQLEEPQANFMKNKMVPALFEAMEKSPYKMSHYVNVFQKSPEQGFPGFFEYPRYLAGYTTTFHMLSFTIETHMLKPYAERVRSTNYLLKEIIRYTAQHDREIRDIKAKSIQMGRMKKHHVLQWHNDTSRYDMIEFSGYRAKIGKSAVTGLDQLYYDREDVWTKMIPFYNYFKPDREVVAPEYYIIPGAWHDVIGRLKYSNIEMTTLDRDTTMMVETYFIESFLTTNDPYNGHYWHYNTDVRKEMIMVQLYSGDKVIPVNQRGATYIVHALEPHAYDSFFSWNFFDAVLSRNEYFSPYLFEETAREFLENNPEEKMLFEKKKEEEPTFAANSYAQFRWIYERSPWSEPTFRRYPVYRYSGEF